MTAYLHRFRNYLYLCLICAYSAGLGGCSYSLSGAAVPEHWKAIYVPLFEDNSNYGQQLLREDLTNRMITKFQQDGTLQVSDRASASVELQGDIVSVIADQPLAVTGGGTTASRLQVTVRVSAVLIDKASNKQVWKKNFSATGDYDPAGGIPERTRGIEVAIENLTEDILLETVSAW